VDGRLDQRPSDGLKIPFYLMGNFYFIKLKFKRMGCCSIFTVKNSKNKKFKIAEISRFNSQNFSHRILRI